MKVTSVIDLVYVSPGGKVYVGVFPEIIPFSIDHDVYRAFEYNNDKMVFGPSGFGIYDVVGTFDFAGEYITFNISRFLDRLLSENDCGLVCFLPFFLHFLSNPVQI